MARIVPFEPDLICDVCSTRGGFDFMGDILCPECAARHIPSDEDMDEDASLAEDGITAETCGKDEARGDE